MRSYYTKVILWVNLKFNNIDTDFAEKKRQHDEMMRKKLQELKRNVLIELRHHADEDFDEDAVLNDESDSLLFKEDPSILSVFFTSQGVCILTSFVVFMVLNYMLDSMSGAPKKTKVKKQ
jgi:hypothetical protein